MTYISSELCNTILIWYGFTRADYSVRQKPTSIDANTLFNNKDSLNEKVKDDDHPENMMETTGKVRTVNFTETD